MIDIVMTTYNRVRFLKQTLESLLMSDSQIPYRLHVIDDHSADETRAYLWSMNDEINGQLILSRERRGVVPNFNQLWDLVINDQEYPYLCYLQDDMVATKREWLATLVDVYRELKESENIGFASAYDAPEHPMEREIDWNGWRARIKRSSSGQNLFAEKKFWLSIGKPSLKGLDDSERGFPNDGKGSNIDVWFTGCYSLSRFDPKWAAPNCLYNQGKKVLVIPMLKHLGIEKKDSTWRQNRVGGF